MRNNNTLRTVVIITTLCLTSAVAQATVLGKVYKGLGLLDYQVSGAPNYLGDGWDINASTVYQNRTFDFGNIDLTLNGAVSANIGLTKRGIPAASFSMQTSEMSYILDFNTGAQDLTATGSIVFDIDTEINQLGFYDQTFHISNRGEYETDGYLVRNDDTLDFDLGPVDIHGNVFVDVLAAITEPFFEATGTVNPFSKITGRAQKAAELTNSAQAIRSKAEAGLALTDEEINTLVNNTIMAAILGGEPTDNLFDDYMLPEGFLADMQPGTQSAMGAPIPMIVPEPASFALLGLASLVLLRRRDA